MALTLKRLLGSGGADLQPQGKGSPSNLRKLLTVLSKAVGAVPAWSSELTVTTHVVTLATAGPILCVDATAGTAAGGKILQSAASPAAGFVQVAYSGTGAPTLTFNATDAITGCKVVQILLSESVSVEA